MFYIIFDLEWNNAYSHAVNGFMNEVIEIGAIKLDEKLNIVDTFKQLVKPTFAKKLSSRCKNLTKITNEEIKSEGIPFNQAMSDFARWCDGEKSIFLSWSDSDLYVLSNNYRVLKNDCNIPFMHRYCDAQKYCMSFIEKEDNNQVSLQRCADIFDIEIDTESLHRALADCYVTKSCFEKVFDKNNLEEYVKSCDKIYFEKLLYKPYLITKPVSDDFNVYEQKLFCPRCKGKLRRLRDFECVNKSFRCPTCCDKCETSYWTTIRAKKFYDNVDVYIRTVDMNRKKARRLK